MRHAVTQDQAAKMVRAHDEARVSSWHFAREVFDAMLAQPKATGVRVYPARGTDGRDTLVVVATDGEDDLAGVIAEEATPCPPFCAGTRLFA